MSLGANIRRLRQDKGWSQADLSARTGIKVGHISTLEKDRGNPTLDTLRKLWQTLECVPNDLLLEVGDMDRDTILEHVLRRALQLPDVNKAAIIEVVDGYCRACGIEQAFTPGNSKVNWLRLYTKAPERVPLSELEFTNSET